MESWRHQDANENPLWGDIQLSAGRGMPAFGGWIGESRKRSDDIYIIVQNSRRYRESVVHSGVDIGNRFSLVCPINTARDRDGFGSAIL